MPPLPWRKHPTRSAAESTNGGDLGSCALHVVCEFGRGEGAALEEIADGIGRKLRLLGLGMGAVLLGLAGRAVPQPVRPRIVPPARLVVGHAVEDLEADVRVLEPD